MPLGEDLQNVKAYIVSRRGILRSGIAKAHDQSSLGGVVRHGGNLRRLSSFDHGAGTPIRETTSCRRPFPCESIQVRCLRRLHHLRQRSAEQSERPQRNLA